jgi:hypothetical protein
LKTFRQFINERYYKPNEKLPSGRSPLEKAKEKEKARNSNIGPNSNIRRMNLHADKMTKVKRGADNKDYDTSPSQSRNVDVEGDSDYLHVTHRPSKIKYAVTNVGDGIHTIEWSHEKGDKKNLSRAERMKLAHSAKQVWNKHVSHRLPHGDVAHNKPSQKSKKSENDNSIVNRRERIYQRSGFGPSDKHNDQFAKINREPSPRQKAKGKSRLSPLDPKKFKQSIGWED